MNLIKIKTLGLVMALVLLVLTACVHKQNQNENTKAISSLSLETADAMRMLKTIETVSETSRQYGEEEAAPARQFIYDTLVEYGYEVSKNEFTSTQEEIVFLEGHEGIPDDEMIEGKHYKVADVTRQGSNIVATKRPNDRSEKKDILIVSAHYDSGMDCPGANDNGSGVAALLEIARLIKDMPSSMELRVIAFDGEEALLTGSYYYVAGLQEEELQRIIGVINFDMFAAKEADGMQLSTMDGRPNALSQMFDGFKLRDVKSASDHVSFMSVAIPVVSISHEPDSLNHTSEDTLAQIDKEKLVMAVNKGVEAISKIAENNSPPYIQKQKNEESKVFHLKLSDGFPFFENVRTVEEQLGITTVQVPIYDVKWQQVQLDFKTLVNWWGEALETHFIYEFMTISDSMLSYIAIDLSDMEATKSFLNKEFTPIENVENYYFFGFENENISEAWLIGENALMLNEDNGDFQLIITHCQKE